MLVLPRRAGLALGLALLSSSQLGCPAAQPMLTVRVQSGLRAGLEIGYVEARVARGASSCTDEAGTVASGGSAVTRGDQDALRTGALGVAELGGLEPGVYTVRARFHRPPDDARLGADSGAVLAVRCVAVTLVASRVVRIALTTDCLDAACPSPSGDPANTQCLNGRCVAPGCDPDDPGTAELCCDAPMTGPDCDPGVTLCGDASDCPRRLTCAGERACVGSVCVEPADDACEPGTYCAAIDGGRCVPDGSSVPDAGPRDAGPSLDAPALDAPTPDAPAPDAPTADAPAPDAYVPPPPCGARGQPCCAGGACDAFATCSGGTCTGCGGVFEMCCPGGGCISALGCEGGWCACHNYAESCDTIPCCPGYVCNDSSGGGCCATTDMPCNPADGSIYCCGSDWCCDVGGGEGRCRPMGSC